LALAHAELGHRTAVVDATQLESSTRVGYQGLMYIRQTNAWTNAVACPDTWSYFNAKENPHFVATVLAARMSKSPLTVVVDDALAKVDGICQVINMQL
jgi:hypothetical protein